MSSEALNRSAAEALEAARQHLDDLSERAFPGHREREAVADNDAARWDQARFERLSNLCAAAHIAVENSIKAHISAIAHKRFKIEHRIEVLLRELPAPTRDEFQRRIAPLAPNDIDPWRSAATYGRSCCCGTQATGCGQRRGVVQAATGYGEQARADEGSRCDGIADISTAEVPTLA